MLLRNQTSLFLHKKEIEEGDFRCSSDESRLLLRIFIVNQRWRSSRDPNVTPTTTKITVGDIYIRELCATTISWDAHQLFIESSKKDLQGVMPIRENSNYFWKIFYFYFIVLVSKCQLSTIQQNRVEKLLKLGRRYKKDTFSEDSVWHYFLTAFIVPSLNLLNLQSTFFVS